MGGGFISSFPENPIQEGPSGPVGPVGLPGPPGTGAYLGTTVITVTGTFTTGPNTHKLIVRLVGGGGGGGSAKQVGGIPAVAPGGSAGAYAEKTFNVTPSTGYAAVVGGGGPGGSAAANNPGTDGGDTTFTVAPTTVTATGGKHGPAGSVSLNPIISNSSPVTPAGTNGDINCPGECGDVGFSPSLTQIVGGKGGNSPYGSGGQWSSQASANGQGFGSGGSGGSDTTGAGVKGGDGASGVIIVEEYA